MAFWIVDAIGGIYCSTPIFFILDDENNDIEECTKEQVNAYADLGIKIEYKEGSIPESGKNWIGKKTWDDCPILCRSNNRGSYYVLREYHIREEHSPTLEGHIRRIWTNMKLRCTKYTKCSESYKKRGIYVDDSFKDFDNFLNWFKSQPNLKYIKEAKLQVDKDLKGKGYYGVDSCLLLPRSLNCLLSDLTRNEKKNLPLGCHPTKNGVQLLYQINHKLMSVTDDMKDTSHSDEYILNMMQEFMKSRNMKTWNYVTPIIDVGRKWLTYKRIVLERFRAEAKRCYDKGWITLEAYNLCLAYDIKITD